MSPIALLLVLAPQAVNPRPAPSFCPLAPRTVARGPAEDVPPGLVRLLAGADWTAE